MFRLWRSLLIEFIMRFNTNLCNETLNKLHQAIKLPEKLSRDVILVLDNAWPHIAIIVKANIPRTKWKHNKLIVLQFSYIFGPLKKDLKGNRIESNAEIQNILQRVQEFLLAVGEIMEYMP